MPTQDNAASIQGVAVRVTRLDPLGNLLNTAGDSYTTAAFVQVTFTPEYNAGDEITQVNAGGAVCVTYQAPDSLKRITIELAICEPDPELTALVSGGLLLRKNLGTLDAPINQSVGWASPAVGDNPAGNGVCIEAWSLAVIDGRKSVSLPFFHWVFPFTMLQLTGDRVIENGMVATTFSGYGLDNYLFGSGPDGRWEYPTAVERPYSYARTTWAPLGYNGFYIWHEELTGAVNNSVLASDIVTLTTSTAHGFSIGEEVTVTGVGATYNGVFTIVAVPTTTTFTYALTHADVATAAVSPVGAAVVAADGVPITDLPEGDTSDFNVPGNVDYDGEDAIDYILQSTLDPTS